MSFTLPELTYPVNGLEPHIDATTMEIHHGKHHGAYVNNLNKALESATELASRSLEELLADTRQLECRAKHGRAVLGLASLEARILKLLFAGRRAPPWPGRCLRVLRNPA